MSKAIDKKLGAERKIVGLKPYTNDGSIRGNNYNKSGYERVQLPITAPATPEAQQWDGWGTALKPANEPIVLARKPLSEKTIAENVMKWGTGGININGCRIGTDIVGWGGRPSSGYGGLDTDTSGKPRPVKGRFPANVILDEEAGRMLDEQSGYSKSSDRPRHNNEFKSIAKGRELPHTTYGYADEGGASRFFYVAKASRSERTHGGKVENNHVTVKPLKLMRYLCRLIAPPGGLILDPFAGSGTTLLAAVQEGFLAIGIEKEPEYCDIIRKRMAAVKEQLPLAK